MDRPLPGIGWLERIIWSILYRGSEWGLSIVLIAFGLSFLDAPGEATHRVFRYIMGTPEDWAWPFILIGTGTIMALIMNGAFPRGTPILRIAASILRSGFWLMLAGAAYSIRKDTGVYTPLLPIFLTFTVMEWIAAIKATWDYKGKADRDAGDS